MTRASEYTKKWRAKFKLEDPNGYKEYRQKENSRISEEAKAAKRITSLKWTENNRDYVNSLKRARRNLYSPAKRKSECLRSKYGITLEQRDSLLDSQGNACAICGTNSPPLLKNGIDGWVVDHCHEYERATGGIKVRGILCLGCNSTIGMAKDSIEILEKAILYLRKHKELMG